MNSFKSISFVIVFLSVLAIQAQEGIPNKVLFIGNSYTYFWNLPHLVEAMAADTEISMSTKQSTAGGAHWGHHWRGERDLETKSKISEGDFDAVILQNHSMSTINRVDSMMHFGNLLNGLIKQSGAKTYVYMTWSREWNPYMIDDIKEKYVLLAEKINARVVPVGLAWQRALELRPGFPLYHPDGSHQSTLGTYLSACVFYGVLTGKTPVGLSHRFISEDINGEKLYLTIQTVENALFCQKVAEDIINEFVD